MIVPTTLWYEEPTTLTKSDSECEPGFGSPSLDSSAGLQWTQPLYSTNTANSILSLPDHWVARVDMARGHVYVTWVNDPPEPTENEFGEIHP